MQPVTSTFSLSLKAQNRGAPLRFGRFGGPLPTAPAPASRGPGRPCQPAPGRPAGPTRSARPLGGAVRPTGPAVRRPVARRRTEPDRPTRTAWPRPPLSAAESAPSAPSGSSWHSSASSRRSAAPTPCALSQIRSSACAFRATGSPQLDILAYQRDTYTNVTGRDLHLEAGRTTSLFKTMTETLNLARTNIASGVKEDDLKPIQRTAKRTVVRRTSPRRTCTTRP